MGAVGPFPGIKKPGREADNSFPSRNEFKNSLRFTTLWCLMMHTDVCILPLYFGKSKGRLCRH
jgi:hypothetical protein